VEDFVLYFSYRFAMRLFIFGVAYFVADFAVPAPVAVFFVGFVFM